jgi:hypothetical protein
LRSSPFDRLRLLDLDDHVGSREHLGRAGDDARAGRDVGGVGGADARARAGLHEHLVTLRGVLAHRHRRESDPMLLDLDFAGHTDAHAEPPADCASLGSLAPDFLLFDLRINPQTAE